MLIDALVGIIGATAVADGPAVEDASRQRLFVAQTCPERQHPPPSSVGHAVKLAVHAKVPWVMGMNSAVVAEVDAAGCDVDIADVEDPTVGTTTTVVGCTTVVPCPLMLSVTVTVVVYPDTTTDVLTGTAYVVVPALSLAVV